jgi:hypothetical protein
VAIRPERGDPALEAASEHDRIDAVDEGAQPAGAGNAVVEFGETAQQAEMMLPPGDNVVDIVAVRDGGASE